jgi:hypothetical protein
VLVLQLPKALRSAFTYTAFFPNDAIKIEGETRSYREMRAAGRWHEVVRAGAQFLQPAHDDP